MLSGIKRVLGSIPKWLLPSTSLVMVAIAAFGYSAVDVSWVQEAKEAGDSPLFATEFLQILARNVGAALVLYSGVVTLGLTTLIGSGILALYVGATVSLGVHSVGGTSLIADVIWYVPFEFLGLILAATAGFQPVAGLATRLVLKKGAVTLGSFVNDIARSLGTLLIALTLIIVGAAIEGFLILLKT